MSATAEPDPQLATEWLTGALPKLTTLPNEIRYAAGARTVHEVAADDNVYIAFNGYAPGQRTRAHIHPNATKIYCVLEGTGHFTLNGEVQVLGPGEWQVARPGEPHGVYNPGPGNLGFLLLIAPRDPEHIWVEE
jgi:mannose-6-phosphate isomerase-like protein (cupin superfamily)